MHHHIPPAEKEKERERDKGRERVKASKHFLILAKGNRLLYKQVTSRNNFHAGMKCVTLSRSCTNGFRGFRSVSDAQSLPRRGSIS